MKNWTSTKINENQRNQCKLIKINEINEHQWNQGKSAKINENHCKSMKTNEN